MHYHKVVIFLIVLALTESCSTTQRVFVDVDVSPDGLLSVRYCNVSSDTVFAPKKIELSDGALLRFEFDTLHVRFPCSEGWVVSPRPSRCPTVIEPLAPDSCKIVFRTGIGNREISWIKLTNFGVIDDLTLSVPGSVVVEHPLTVSFTGGLPRSVTVP